MPAFWKIPNDGFLYICENNQDHKFKIVTNPYYNKSVSQERFCCIECQQLKARDSANFDVPKILHIQNFHLN
jgi:hypothetical protein